MVEAVKPGADTLDLTFLFPEYEGLNGMERLYLDIALIDGDPVLDGTDFDQYFQADGAAVLPLKYYSVVSAREIFIAAEVARYFTDDVSSWRTVSRDLAAMPHLSLAEVYGLIPRLALLQDSPVFQAKSPEERARTYLLIIALEDAIAFHHALQVAGEPGFVPEFDTALRWAITALMNGALTVSVVLDAQLGLNNAEFRPDLSGKTIGVIVIPPTVRQGTLVHEVLHAYRIGEGIFTSWLDDEVYGNVLSCAFEIADRGVEDVFAEMAAGREDYRTAVAGFEAEAARKRAMLAAAPQAALLRFEYIAGYARARIQAFLLPPEFHVKSAAARYAAHQRAGAGADSLAKDEAILRDCLIRFRAYEAAVFILDRVDRDFRPVAASFGVLPAIPPQPTLPNLSDLPPARDFGDYLNGATAMLLFAYQKATRAGDLAAAEAIIDHAFLPYLTGSGYLSDLPAPSGG